MSCESSEWYNIHNKSIKKIYIITHTFNAITNERLDVICKHTKSIIILLSSVTFA